MKTQKRPPGTSGRLHRTETGDWIWSSDDETDESEDEVVNNINNKGMHNSVKAPSVNSLSSNQSAGSTNSSPHSTVGQGNPTANVQPQIYQQPPASAQQIVSQPNSPYIDPSFQGPQYSPAMPANNKPSPYTQPQVVPVMPNSLYEPPPINLVLRIRNKKELNDIRFEFAPGKDSADGIASELVSAGLVDGKDVVVVAANLQKIIDNCAVSKSLTFALSAPNSNNLSDMKALIGFASLSITD